MDKTLLSLLKEIQDNKYDIKSYDAKDIINQTLPFIGTPDPKLRDELIYPVLAHLFHDKHLNENDLEIYLDLLMSDEYLTYDMENKENDSSLKRSFSVLQLVILCYVHRRDHLISVDKINQLFKYFLDYYNHEKILTGYDPKVGWIHTIAHSADLFAQLVQVEHFGDKHILDIFNAIQLKMTNQHHDFICNEDERSVVAVKKALELKKIDTAPMLNWLDGFIIKDKKNIPFPDQMILENNIKRFLRSLYFSIYHEEIYQEIIQKIEFILAENEKR